jgi:hypothetical protein
MPWLDVIWDYEDGGNVEHLAEHDVTPDEACEVLEDPEFTGRSRSSGLPVAFGYTRAGRFLAVVYEQLDKFTVKPVTAYDVEE